MSPLLYTTARVLRHTEKNPAKNFLQMTRQCVLRHTEKKSPAKNFPQMTSLASQWCTHDLIGFSRLWLE